MPTDRQANPANAMRNETGCGATTAAITNSINAAARKNVNIYNILYCPSPYSYSEAMSSNFIWQGYKDSNLN